MEYLLIGMALFLAFNNGANDNFKGFATVWGSAVLTYRQALFLATVATVAGSMASWFLADTLVQQFSGRGLVPSAVASAPTFILGVASGAALTVFLATRLGFPVSTTHALIGGLVGAGLGQAAGAVNFNQLGSAFMAPLLVSPLVAAGLGLMLYKLQGLRRNPTPDCVCVVPVEVASFSVGPAMAAHALAAPGILVADRALCDKQTPTARVIARLSVPAAMRWLHIGSASLICFARGVNDTPKLAALLIASQAVGSQASVGLIGLLMALGGLVFARRVAETMSLRVNRLDDVQGLIANLVTATLVLGASKFGMPVSTTHVSVGSIAGVGSSAKTLNWPALRNVLLSWVATLPLAAALAWLAVKLL